MTLCDDSSMKNFVLMSHLYHLAMRTYPKVKSDLYSLKLLLNVADEINLPINNNIVRDVLNCRLIFNFIYIYPLAKLYNWHAGHELKLLSNDDHLTAKQALKLIKKHDGYIDWYNGIPIKARLLDNRSRPLHLLPYLNFDDRMNQEGALFTRLIKACIFYSTQQSLKQRSNSFRLIDEY